MSATPSIISCCSFIQRQFWRSRLRRACPIAALIGLSTGAFVAFGLFSLPVGWLADRISRRNLLAIFFLGYGASAFGIATAHSPTAFAIWLLVLGIFSAIYHPVGTAMLVAHARRLGHDLGINAVWGNLGAAFASGVTAFLAAKVGWQAAFFVPGALCVAFGVGSQSSSRRDRGA